MKKAGIILACVVILVGMIVVPGMTKKSDECATIQGGTIFASTGELITTGYDQFGYNYQAHMFKGRYCDADRELGGPSSTVKLVMKWNDAWLSNKDCDGDELLDRPDPYKGSGAWCTNHMWETYEVNGTVCEWDYFVKIVAVPVDAVLTAGIWYTIDGVEIGPVEWGSFAVILRVYNEPCGGVEGIEYLSPCGPGLGKW